MGLSTSPRLAWLRLDWALAAALYGLAVAMHWPMLHAPSYGDEGLHYWTARYLGGRLDAVTSVWGHLRLSPPHLVLQRPLYYLAMWPAAQAGFEGFRFAASLAGAAMAPMAFLWLRARDTSRVAAAGAGVAIAILPSLAAWGNLALMDAPMTALVLATLWAHARRRWALMAALAIAACWVKETALFALAALLAYELTLGVSETLHPRRLVRERPALPWLAGAAPLAGGPVFVWIFVDGHLPGGPDVGAITPLVERLVVSPWLVPAMLLAFALPRSRFVAGAAAAAVATFVLLHAAGRGAPLWYDVPAQALALCAAAAGTDAAARATWAAGSPRGLAAVAAVAMLSVGIVGGLAFLEHGPPRLALRPYGTDPGNPYPEAWEFETAIRDADFVRTTAAVPPHAVAVLAFDVYPSVLVQPFLERRSDVAVHFEESEWSLVEFDRPTLEVARWVVGDLARHIEMPGWFTLVLAQDEPLNEAARAVYADCAVHTEAIYVLLEGARCSGRQQQLIDATFPPAA